MTATVTTSLGVLEGLAEDGVGIYRRIPYARPPRGPLRLRAPEPAEAWTGVRDASCVGPSPPQHVDSVSAMLGMTPPAGTDGAL